MPISATGIGSGLDIESIVTQLMALERRPIDALNRKENAYNIQTSAYGTLKSDLSAFQAAVAKIKNNTTFKVYQATPTDVTLLSASASSTAIPGNYSLQINQLAQAQKTVAAGQAASNTAIGGAGTTTLTIDFGTISGGTYNATTGKYTGAAFTLNTAKTTQTVTIDSSSNTLEGIRDAINKVDIGVSATIVNDGSASPYRLVLTSKDSGLANSLRISVAGDAAIQTLLEYNPAGTQNLSQTVTAQDAGLIVDGISVSKPSNTITDVMQGVTLNLAKAGTTTLGITRDNAAITKDIDAFVEAYNKLEKSITGLRAGDLNGDNTLLSIKRQLVEVFQTPANGLGGSFKYLSEIGIAFQKNGTLAVDSSTFENALSGSFNDVLELFSNNNQGFAYRLEVRASDMLKIDGLINNKTDGLDQRIKDLTDRRDVLERRMTSIETRIRAKFTALDGLLSSLQSTSDFLTQQLNNLPKIGK